ncbi:MAG TPA: efflux RND transporter periplasmic adaptor subunit [Holophagaceae bacterium]|nr:efflux RND transporter periplasmic adaptor subunit [Holophagaceae bacterium]
MFKMKNKWILGGAAVVLVAGGIFWAVKPSDKGPQWRTGKVERGNLTQRISATGTLSPLVQVPVGTQVSGVISALYADYNSLVKKGQLIAQIDPTLPDTQLRDAEAALDRARTNAADAKVQFERAQKLAKAQLLADQDLDVKEVAYKTALANLDTAKAALDRAKANRAYCDITAPVDGVVISRMADVGQTVAASFSTPNLFQIARDLSKMKVEISIDEADIDEVKVGQRAFFTVDSLPERQFAATVSQVRLEPITNQNVVTYKVVIEVPNEALNRAESGAAPKGEGKTEGKGEWKRGAAEGGHAAAGAPAGGPMGDMDPEKAWERMKDRLPEGTTKEAFLKRFKERMAERAAALKAAAAPVQKPSVAPAGMSRKEIASTPGGAALLGGPVFAGDLALRPGMTANITIVTNQRQDVLKVPNASLRFNPMAFMPKDETKKADGPTKGGAPVGQGMPGGQRPGGGMGGAMARGMASRREDRVWILENGKPKALVVKAGISDGQYTEVSGEGITEGIVILVGVEDLTKKAAGAPITGGPGMGRR